MPVRAERIRVILTELNRIASHLVFFGTGILDMGALTLFFYTMREREKILDIFESVSGVRMNYGYFRVGGLSARCSRHLRIRRAGLHKKRFPPMMDQYAALFAKNDIFLGPYQRHWRAER